MRTLLQQMRPRLKQRPFPSAVGGSTTAQSAALPGARHFLTNLLRQGTALRDLRLWLLVTICVALLALLAQRPLNYAIQIGQERGVGSDLPFLDSFNPGEGSGAGRFRWSKSNSFIEIPGVGRRSLILGMQVVSHRAQWDSTAPPTQLVLRSANGRELSLTLRLEGARYRVLLPPTALPDGSLRLELITSPWRSPGDNRSELGVALGRHLTLTSTRAPGFVLPHLGSLVAWPASLALLWLALNTLGFVRPTMLLLLLPVAVGAPLTMLLDLPRFGFAAGWAPLAALLTLVAASFAMWIAPPLLLRAQALPPPTILRWLLLLAVLSLTLKYGARLYPDSMPGDLQLHINRYNMAVAGDVYIEAQHRGLPFPFPPAFYLLLAPFTLSGLDLRLLFQFTAGLFEATTVLMLYVLLHRLARNPTLALIGAAAYALVPAGSMSTWFAFETQVAAQWFTTLLITLLVLHWPHYRGSKLWWLLMMLFVQVFLGHIGQFINTSLVGLLLVPLLWWRAPDEATRNGARYLAGIGLAAGLFVAAFYYTAFLELILGQVAEVSSVGLVEATGKPPIPRSTSLWVLWDGGLIDHLGFFPAPLAAVGLLLMTRSRLRQTLLPTLITISFLVSTTQALLPLITLSSITTRWLMFSVWAICVAAAPALLELWRRGRVGRVVTLAITGFVAWTTIIVWINAMALRLPPIEPF